MKTIKNIDDHISKIKKTSTKEIVSALDRAVLNETFCDKIESELAARDKINNILYSCLHEIISGRSWKELPQERRKYIREQEESYWRLVLDL